MPDVVSSCSTTLATFTAYRDAILLGTSARLTLELWPSRKLIGYEIDELLVHQAREYFGLSALEVPTSEGGVLSVVVDDAFADSSTVEGGFAGIIADLFAGGELPPQLRQPETWVV
ncbi:hypothetical protein R1flu_027662 [Riccia fluitans]|uniref:Uncharacterized protein n=1 Tax=Riccia fluitans TaxID=41844 RepID=A0ABD1XJZ5_9MARC